MYCKEYIAKNMKIYIAKNMNCGKKIYICNKYIAKNIYCKKYIAKKNAIYFLQYIYRLPQHGLQRASRWSLHHQLGFPVLLSRDVQSCWKHHLDFMCFFKSGQFQPHLKWSKLGVCRHTMDDSVVLNASSGLQIGPSCLNLASWWLKMACRWPQEGSSWLQVGWDWAQGSSGLSFEALA